VFFSLCVLPTVFSSFTFFFVVMNAESGTRSSSPIVIDSDSCVESDSDARPIQVRGSPLKVLHSKRYR